jgi:hypothetical protein
MRENVMRKVVDVTECGECKHFDDVYWTNNQWCELLDREIPWDGASDSNPIPKDCPLPDAEEERERVGRSVTW